MNLIQTVNENVSIESAVKAIQDTIDYAKNLQKGQLDTRSAINFLAGRLKAENGQLTKLLDELLKHTK